MLPKGAPVLTKCSSVWRVCMQDRQVVVFGPNPTMKAQHGERRFPSALHDLILLVDS